MSPTADFDEALEPYARELIAKAGHFGQTHLAVSQRRAATAPRKLLADACQKGLASMEVPVEMGGASAPYSVRMRICEELARYDAAFAFSLVNHHNATARIAVTATSTLGAALVPDMLAGRKFGCTAMTEPQSGSDFTRLRTHAVQAGCDWVLTGEKAWIANAAFADVFLVYAQTDESAGTRGIAGFVVLASDEGFERDEAYDVPGIEGTGVSGFRLKGCRLPAERLLYPAGDGFMSAMRGVNQARVHVAAMNAGMVAAALDLALHYGEQRQAFGKSVLDFQGLGWSLASVATDLEALRLLTYSAARTIDVGKDAQRIAAMAKKYANEHGVDAINACMQAMGAAALKAEYPLMRHLSCARAFCYTDGTPEMMNERISHLLRKSLSMKH